jgi:membrane protein
MLSLTRLSIRRAREERLPQIAGSLTFTTVLSIVPLLAVSFALLTRFPVFARFELALEESLLKSLLPADISRTVLRYLNQFAENANGLTLLGSLFLLATALALLLTIENALNQIWDVRTARPFFKRIGLYLLMLAIGPPLLGASLWATSYVLSASVGLIATVPPAVGFVLTLGPLLLSAAGLAAMFYFVPNTQVRRRDAVAGGLLAGIAFELGKRGFAACVMKVPTYKAVYGAFAAFPVLLLWVYFSWLVTLAAALVAANLSGARQRPAGKGWRGAARVRR